ncbi:hypothetical protein L1887_40780 [Cichorium endivia]|nr:hypothetical protein L1887_40780 [Cichorium endivia]
MDSLLVDVCKGLETVTVVGVGVGDCVGGVVGFGIDVVVVDLSNEFKVVFMVDVNGLGTVGVDVDDGLVESLEMDADASWAEFEDFDYWMQLHSVDAVPRLFELSQVKPRAWTEVGDSDHQKDVAFQEDEVIASEIISNTTETFEHDDISSNGLDDEIDNDVEGEFDDANNSGDDGIADSEGSFEYSTSENEEEVQEEDECDDSD